MRIPSLVALAAACAVGVSALSAQAVTYNETFTLTGAQEVPPVTTNAIGAAQVAINFDTASNTMNYSVVWGFLSSSVQSVTFNAPAAPGTNGPVVLTLSNLSPITGNNTIGSLSGSASVPDSLESAILGGNSYINITTANHPTGEIRGYLPPSVGVIPEPAALSLMGLSLAGLALRLGRRAR